MNRLSEEDLLLYLYNEASPQLRSSIELALESDVELQSQLKKLDRTIRQLSKLNLSSPSKQSMLVIKNHLALQAKRNK